MENDMAAVLSPEQAARIMLEAAVAGPLGMRPTHALKHFTLRQRAMDRGVHLDDFLPALEYAVQQGWLEPLEGAFFRLTEPGYAAVSSPSATAPPPTLSQAGIPAAAVIVNGGVVYSVQTGDHANAAIHGAASTPVSAPTPEPSKSPWWKSWWAITSGVMVVLAGLIPTLEYLHIEWPWHHEAAASQAQQGQPPAPAQKPPSKPAASSQPPPAALQLAPEPKPAAKATTESRPKRSHELKPVPTVVNSVGTVYNNSGIIAPGATGSITQQVQGYVPPPPRVMTDEQQAAAVAKLQTAPPGSIARLNCAASDDNQEVQGFFAQVERAFRKADHWRVSTQRIGKSMGTADGSTLTAEGMGCTVAGSHGGIAVDAMAAAGFPCTRKAADWGVASPPPGDVVISIGSRIAPLE
jgi:hypothetical protein